MNTLAFTLILFLTITNPAGGATATASIKTGFNSVETCVAAAKELSAGLKAVNRGAEVIWSCVQQ